MMILYVTNFTRKSRARFGSQIQIRRDRISRAVSLVSLVALMALSGCSHLDQNKGNNKIYQTSEGLSIEKNTDDQAIQGGGTVGVLGGAGDDNSRLSSSSQFSNALPSEVGRVPVLSEKNADSARGNNRAPRLTVREIDAYVDPLPVPQFIDVVFGKMLMTPYVTGPDVAKMTDLVQLRSSGKIQASDFLSLIKDALENYGVRVVPQDGTYQLVQDKALRTQTPRFIKSRARLRTRSDLRPVIQFVELNALDANSMLIFLQQAFGRQNDKIKIEANQGRNFISLAGLPEDVDAAVAIIRELDELNYAGSQVRKYSPKYWNAKDFSTELAKALRVEGWSVTDNINLQRTIMLMPVEYSNSVFIFSKSEAANRRIDDWVIQLDQPVSGGDTEQIFVFQVKNVEAELLADTANQVLFSRENNRAGVSPIAGNPQIQPASGGGLSGGLGGEGGSQSGVFTVDKIGNRIIFTGTAREYEKLIRLLEQLDTPAPEVLIEVQIAEVTLTDDTNFGVEFFIDDLGDENVQATLGSQGLGLGSTGLNIGLLSGNVDASINAFASNRRVKLLSKPTLTARSGSDAELSVGQEIPILTSQRAANNQNGTGNLDIIQEVAYRETGVILSLTPTVYSDNRIDLTISQEVSSTVAASNSSIPSPTISNRSLSTQLSLQDGQTAVLGGLIQDDRVLNETGVPILKDLPIIGNAFSTEAINSTRTELVVLITAYVLRGQQDRNEWVNRLGGQINGVLEDESQLLTLLPKQF